MNTHLETSFLNWPTDYKARHEADSFEAAEWSERLTPGQSGWLGAAAVGSIPALALSLFLQRLLSKESSLISLLFATE